MSEKAEFSKNLPYVFLLSSKKRLREKFFVEKYRDNVVVYKNKADATCAEHLLYTGPFDHAVKRGRI